MKQTSNFGLSQWDAKDRILREEFNGDHLKVDAALKAQKDEIVALTAALALKGNCQLWTTSYVGGQATITINFPKKPTLVCVLGQDGYIMVTEPNVQKIYVNPSSVYDFPVSWTDTTLSWNTDKNGASRLNATGVSYQVVALISTN